MKKKVTWKNIWTSENLWNFQAGKTFNYLLLWWDYETCYWECVRCGTRVYEPRALRCPECRKLVDKELNGEANKPFQYYFSFNLKKMKDENDKMWEMLKDYGKEMS